MTSSFQSTAFQSSARPVDTFVAPPSVQPKTDLEELAEALQSINPAIQTFLGSRIKNFVNEPKLYKIAADFGNAEGWLLNQMNRAFESGQNPNFIPKYDLVSGKKKIVAFTDNQYGGGKTYYALKKYAKKFNGIMMTEHPDFKNTKKYIHIAKRVRLAPNKVIKYLEIIQNA